jgi:transposase
LRAALIQILFSIRSERQLMEQMQYNLLFRRFVGLGVDDPVWVPTVFTKNRDRLLTTDIAGKFHAAILSTRWLRPYCRTSISRGNCARPLLKYA